MNKPRVRQHFDSVKSLLTVLNIFGPRSVPIVTALPAASATADLFRIAISAVTLDELLSEPRSSTEWIDREIPFSPAQLKFFAG
jgi:hypothetical protein